MRNRMSEKVLNCFLFLIIGFLVLFSPFTSNAQNSNSLNLEDTEWQATETNYYTSYYPAATIIYGFRAQSKVRVLVTVVDSPPPQTSIDPVTGQWKTQYYSPTIRSVSDLTGTYKQNGNSIRLELPDYFINATIKGNRINGDITNKESNAKVKWAAERISGGNKTNSTNNNSASAATITGLSTESGDNSSNNSSPSAATITGLSTSNAEDSGYPNVMRNADGTLRPAGGYRWVNPKDPKDFRVERIP